MLAFRVWKEWKKKLKRRRRPVWSLGALAAPVLFMALSGAGDAAAGNRTPADRETDDLVIDERGMLTLTDDPRLRSNAVRTFFQLSIRALEISLPERRGNRLA